MDLENIPYYYTELPQDELKLLLAYNTYQLERTDNPEERSYYQTKIDYILALIKE